MQICGGDRDTLYPDLSGTESTAQNLLLSFGHKILALARTLVRFPSRFTAQIKKSHEPTRGACDFFMAESLGVLGGMKLK